MIWEKLAAFCFIICLFSLCLNLETGVSFFLTCLLKVALEPNFGSTSVHEGSVICENMFSAGVWLGLSVEALTGKASV